jgi:hypothetical protein
MLRTATVVGPNDGGGDERVGAYRSAGWPSSWNGPATCRCPEPRDASNFVPSPELAAGSSAPGPQPCRSRPVPTPGIRTPTSPSSAERPWNQLLGDVLRLTSSADQRPTRLKRTAPALRSASGAGPVPHQAARPGVPRLSTLRDRQRLMLWSPRSPTTSKRHSACSARIEVRPGREAPDTTLGTRLNIRDAVQRMAVSLDDLT